MFKAAKTRIKKFRSGRKKNNNISEDNSEDDRNDRNDRKDRNKNIDNNCPKVALVGAILFIIAVLV